MKIKINLDAVVSVAVAAASVAKAVMTVTNAYEDITGKPVRFFKCTPGRHATAFPR